MRKSILLACGITALSAASLATADAAVRTYWDQASGKWMKYDTNANRASPVSPNAGNTTTMGRPQQANRGSPIARQTIDYKGPFKANTLVIDTSERRLYYIFEPGRALKYGVGVGREGFQWAGVDHISRKAEWPGWTPPPEMIAREKKNGRTLPAYMEGGPNNPLGARALYIGGTLYRIHGSNEPWTIGQAVSSGCIRMTNEDVSHLYERVRVGTRVVVLRGDESAARLAALANPPPPVEAKKVEVAEARTKDDGLASIGIGVAVAGTIPAEESTSAETTASVAPAPAAAEPVAALPEARTKDDVLAAPPAAVAATEQPEAAEAARLPVDDAAKDDAVATLAPSEDATSADATEQAAATDATEAEPPAAVEAAVEAPAPVEPAPADPAAKDDDIATDLGGGTVPIEGGAAPADETASTSAAMVPRTVAN